VPSIETDVIVVGAGPAGGSAGLFLAKAGVGVLVISRYLGTADTPRAHIVNQRAAEVLRDAGIEEACRQVASPGSLLAHSFWLSSMTGEELARTWAWGNDPARSSEYLTASPCSMMDLPQDRMEPILLGEISRLGGHVRFGWELRSFTQDEDGVTADVLDRLSGEAVSVRAKYLVGADGARSRVVQQLGLPLVGQEGLGTSFNILCDVDLSEYTRHRNGSLFTVIQPDAAFGPVVVFRMVKPWNQWLATLLVPAGVEVEPNEIDFLERIKLAIGKPDLPVTILSTSKWTINDVYAESYSSGRVFALGDAVHRHPPTNALGSNTCLQDGFNLSWKLAYVLRGLADPSLLDSFSAERQPVGQRIVTRANQSWREHLPLMGLLGAWRIAGMSEDDARDAISTSAGRRRVRDELERAAYNYMAHGVDMGARYSSGAFVDDSFPESAVDHDAELYYVPSTKPGSYLPHAWLVKREPSPLVSTLDLAGKGRFHIFTGPGGDRWREAAKEASRRTGIELGVTSVGPTLDYEDPYGDWSRVSEVDDDGCVLVRPDLVVGWRSRTSGEDAVERLLEAVRQILGRQDIRIGGR
jgi:2,4-dichlorophenol 6-monooxygenase